MRKGEKIKTHPNRVDKDCLQVSSMNLNCLMFSSSAFWLAVGSSLSTGTADNPRNLFELLPSVAFTPLLLPCCGEEFGDVSFFGAVVLMFQCSKPKASHTRAKSSGENIKNLDTTNACD
jgi:hypothetical protein